MRRVFAPAIAVLAACSPLWAQSVVAGTGDPPQDPLPALVFSHEADPQGVSLSLVVRGQSAEGVSALEDAVAAAHRRLLQLVGLQPSPQAAEQFGRCLVLEDEKPTEDGGVEVRARIDLAEFARLVAAVKPETELHLAPLVGDEGPPRVGGSVMPVRIGADGSMERLPGPGAAKASLAPAGADPQSIARARNAIGMELAALGRLEEAVAAFQEACGLFAGTAAAAEPHSNLGAVHFAEKRYAEAMREYQAAVAADPKYPLARYGLGVTLRALNQSAMAVAELTAFLGLQPAGPLAEAARDLLTRMGATPPMLALPGETGIPPAIPPAAAGR